LADLQKQQLEFIEVKEVSELDRPIFCEADQPAEIDGRRSCKRSKTASVRSNLRSR